MKKPKPYEDCTIMRRSLWTSYTLNLITGAHTDGETIETVEPCGTPLFSAQERTTGICNSCRSGYSEPGNEFASDDERARATAGQPAE